ncbi:MAG: thioredoxin TrxA [Pseudomonadota bacterium]
MSDKIVHVTEDDFEDTVLKADGPVLVDFWAEWCGPCKMIAPLLDQVADEFGDKITIAKMDVEANKQTPMKYQVRGIPTLIIFKDGNIAATKVGALNKSQLSAFIEGAV